MARISPSPRTRRYRYRRQASPNPANSPQVHLACGTAIIPAQF
ncbi:hypothetical protein SOQ14_06070 [Erythrobacter sp. T5W1-R]|nr:hypothetical protein [Erythrobacter sp. T5W1-R]MEA1618478.1 hypothetical protein [Erythrobacter sp. T5W1-R]